MRSHGLTEQKYKIIIKKISTSNIINQDKNKFHLSNINNNEKMFFINLSECTSSVTERYPSHKVNSEKK